METLHYLEHAATKKPLFRLIFPTRELAIEAASKMNKTPIGKPHSCTVGETTNLWGSLIETCEDEQRCRPQRVLHPTHLLYLTNMYNTTNSLKNINHSNPAQKMLKPAEKAQTFEKMFTTPQSPAKGERKAQG